MLEMHSVTTKKPTAQLDRDGDGVVSIDELHEILDDCNIEITRDQLQELLQTEGGLSNGELVTPEVFRVCDLCVWNEHMPCPHAHRCSHTETHAGSCT